MTPIKAVFWDLGGVVVADNVQEGFEKHGIRYSLRQKNAWRRHRTGITTSTEFWQEALEGTGRESEPGQIEKTTTELIKPLTEGALPLMCRLHQQAVPQGVISNHTCNWADYIANMTQFRTYIHPDLELISSAVKLDKDTPRIFDLALSRIQLTIPTAKSSDLLFFDDRPKNIEVARRAGWNAEIYSTRNAAVEKLKSYGFQI